MSLTSPKSVFSPPRQLKLISVHRKVNRVLFKDFYCYRISARCLGDHLESHHAHAGHLTQPRAWPISRIK